jgi:hypothetical protein
MGAGGEMTQALYAHMNNKRKKNQKTKILHMNIHQPLYNYIWNTKEHKREAREMLVLAPTAKETIWFMHTWNNTLQRQQTSSNNK